MRYLSLSLLIVALLAVLAVLVAPMSAQQSRPGQQQAAQDDQSDRPKIDVESYAVDVTLAPQEHRLAGKADIRFKQLDRKAYATLLRAVPGTCREKRDD